MEAELTDWLSEAIAHEEQRQKAEELFKNYDGVEVKLEKGKFKKLRGSKDDINSLEEDLMRMYADGGRTHMSHAADDDGTDAGREQLPDPRDRFTDEMDVEEHAWQYLLFEHANLLGDFAFKHSCGVGLKHSLDSKGQIESRVKVTAKSKAHLEAASEEIVSLLQVLLEKDIQRRQVDLRWKEHFAELEEELKKKGVLLLTSPCYVVGPASTLNAAESIVTAAVNKICDAKSSPAAVSDDDTKRDIFSFHIPLVRLTVHVRQGIQRLLFQAYLMIPVRVFLLYVCLSVTLSVFVWHVVFVSYGFLFSYNIS